MLYEIGLREVMSEDHTTCWSRGSLVTKMWLISLVSGGLPESSITIFSKNSFLSGLQCDTWWFTEAQSWDGRSLVYSKWVMYGVPGIKEPPMICQYKPKNQKLSLKKVNFSWQSPYLDIQGHIGAPKSLWEVLDFGVFVFCVFWLYMERYGKDP